MRPSGIHPFIDFMLGEIHQALMARQGDPLPDRESNKRDAFGEIFGDEFSVRFGVKFGANEKRVLLLIHSNPMLSAAEIAEQTGLGNRGVEKQNRKFRELGIITRIGGDKGGHRRIND